MPNMRIITSVIGRAQMGIGKAQMNIGRASALPGLYKTTSVSASYFGSTVYLTVKLKQYIEFVLKAWYRHSGR